MKGFVLLWGSTRRYRVDDLTRCVENECPIHAVVYLFGKFHGKCVIVESSDSARPGVVGVAQAAILSDEILKREIHHDQAFAVSTRMLPSNFPLL